MTRRPRGHGGSDVEQPAGVERGKQRGVSLIAGRHTKYLVLLFWLVIFLVATPLAGHLTGAEDNSNQSWLPANAESTKVLGLEGAFQSPNLLTAVVVYDRAGGLTAADRAKVRADARRDASVGHLDGQVTGPIVSADGKAALVEVPLDLGPNGWKGASAVVARLSTIAGGDRGLAAHVTGPAGYAAASSDAFNGIDGTLLYGTILIVVLILLLTYRSPLVWMLPVLSAGVALISAEAVIYLLASHLGLTVNALSVGILTVLVFGAGTDYALLLVARFREELRRNRDRHEAMQIALRRASPAIIASASTVILGLLCLAFAENNSTRGLGPVVAIGVAVALFVMLTLLPALLVTVDRWVFWPVEPRFGSAEPTATGLWARVGQRIARHPRRIWVVTTVCLGVMATGVTLLHANGLTNSQSYRNRPGAVVGEAVVDSHFSAGVGSPVVVIADARSADAVESAFSGVSGIVGVTVPVTTHGRAYLQGTLSVPADSQAAYRVVDAVRNSVHAVIGADAMVGGSTAINLDVERAAAHDRNLIIPIVLLVVFIILAVLLRSLLAPAVLMATVVLSLAAALGLSAFVFTHVFGFRGCGHVPAALCVRLPGRARYRLQHLPHVTGSGRLQARRHAIRGCFRPRRNRWCHHLGRFRAGRHVRSSRNPAADNVHRGRLRSRVRGAARHHPRTLGPGHGAQPRTGGRDLVAESPWSAALLGTSSSFRRSNSEPGQPRLLPVRWNPPDRHGTMRAPTPEQCVSSSTHLTDASSAAGRTAVTLTSPSVSGCLRPPGGSAVWRRSRLRSRPPGDSSDGAPARISCAPS